MATHDGFSIRLLVTGGTFDKVYNELDGMLSFRDTHVHEMLRSGRSRLDVQVEVVTLMDSLDMTDEIRGELFRRCVAATEQCIVITHGTDTMSETARFIGSRGIRKTVVLTGAMIPYAFGSSDGHFNLGAALAFAQTLPAGVYIAMNGKAFSWEDVKKDRVTGTFVRSASQSIAA